MALIISAASGNFNAGATWVGGVVPIVGDEARAANGHTITITANATCDEISNAGTGRFVITDGVTLTANVTSKSGSAGNCLEFSANAPASATIVGICNGGQGNGSAVANLGTGTMTITGLLNGGRGEFGSSIVNAVRNNAAGIVNITGNCLGGGLNSSSAAYNNGTGQINITGECIAGSAASANGATNNSTGTLSVIGTIRASHFASGVAGANAAQVTILSGPFLTETVRGVAPVHCVAWRWNASVSNSTYMEVMTNNLLAKRNLVTDNNVTGMPAVTNVRSGTVYGPTSSLTGTLVVPSANSVSFGVPVDNTTGTAVLTPEAVWSHATRTITGGTVDTLTNAPTVPSASAIASQVRTELSVELGRVDAAISTRATPANIPTADITAIKGKTDLLNTTRLAQVSTTEIVGSLLAQANS